MERELIGELLLDVSKIKTVEIEPKWFKDRQLSYIVEEIKRTNGDDTDLSLLADKIKKNNQNSTIEKENIIEIFSEAITNARIEDHARELKLRYYERIVEEKARLYSQNTNIRNFEKMKDAISNLEKVKYENDEKSMRTAITELYEEMENGTKTGVHTFRNIDTILGDGMAGGMFIVIGARPSVGKTAFGVNLAAEALKKEEKVTVDFFSLEMAKKEMLKRFVSRETEINSYKFVNTKLQLTQEEKNKVVAKAEWLDDKGLNLIDDCFTLDQIERAIRRNKYDSKGKYIAFIDYLQLIDVNTNEQRYLQIGKMTRKMKRLSNELDIPIVAFSQLSRGLEARQDKTPTLADLRESGDIEQDAHAVGFLHKDEEDENTIMFDLAKNRNGRTGRMPFNFIRSISYFEEA